MKPFWNGKVGRGKVILFSASPVSIVIETRLSGFIATELSSGGAVLALRELFSSFSKKKDIISSPACAIDWYIGGNALTISLRPIRKKQNKIEAAIKPYLTACFLRCFLFCIVDMRT